MTKINSLTAILALTTVLILLPSSSDNMLEKLGISISLVNFAKEFMDEEHYS